MGDAGLNKQPKDVCACGDYRYQHQDGSGPCLLNGLGHGIPGFRCDAFIFTTAATNAQETAWLIERGGLYSTGPVAGQGWTGNHLEAFRFRDRLEAERWRNQYAPDALATEHAWISNTTHPSGAQR